MSRDYMRPARPSARPRRAPAVTRAEIRERYIHGVRYTARDGRRAEALRHYAGVWHVYVYAPGASLPNRSPSGEGMSYADACRACRAALA